ncbi:MAG: hypothetical protein JRH20_17545 [Deltaproteobacteria bacterium]|nr:hypothetical protein [Deltaproteobacteria bacterium]
MASRFLCAISMLAVLLASSSVQATPVDPLALWSDAPPKEQSFTYGADKVTGSEVVGERIRAFLEAFRQLDPRAAESIARLGAQASQLVQQNTGSAPHSSLKLRGLMSEAWSQVKTPNVEENLRQSAAKTKIGANDKMVRNSLKHRAESIFMQSDGWAQAQPLLKKLFARASELTATALVLPSVEQAKDASKKKDTKGRPILASRVKDATALIRARNAWSDVVQATGQGQNSLYVDAGLNGAAFGMFALLSEHVSRRTVRPKFKLPTHKNAPSVTQKIKQWFKGKPKEKVGAKTAQRRADAASAFRSPAYMRDAYGKRRPDEAQARRRGLRTRLKVPAHVQAVLRAGRK